MTTDPTARQRARAREAPARAAAEDDGLAILFRLGAKLRPSLCNLTRIAQRLARLSGVLRVPRRPTHCAQWQGDPALSVAPASMTGSDALAG